MAIREAIPIAIKRHHRVDDRAPSTAPPTDPTLEDDLRGAVRGEVRFDQGSRGLYSTGASNYRQVPIGVVVPRDIDDVVSTVAVCRAHGAPVLSRGGGTSLAGQSCNVAVVMDFSKYVNRIVDLDPGGKRARIQPGLVLDRLRDAAEAHNLTYGPDPATHDHCTLGGMIGNNSCGVHALMAGKTVDNVEELEILTYDGLRMRVGATSDDELEAIIRQGGRRGEIYQRLRELRDRYGDLVRQRYPNIPRRVSGYNLDQLLPENGFHVARALVGTEGTCVTILEATVRLVPSPQHRVLLVLGYPDVYTAGDHIMQVLEHKPIGLEGLDDVLVDDMIRNKIHPGDVELLPRGNGWLMVEFGADSHDEAVAQARAAMDAIKRESDAPAMKLIEDRSTQLTLWKVRESGLGATARVPGDNDTWEGWEDSAVPPEQLGGYLRDLRALFNKYEYGCALYGHFGQGCVHTRIDFDLTTHDGIKKFRSFVEEAADLVVRYGGSLSGEHGDGQSRAELLPRMFGDELVGAFREFKGIWDPDNKMNPHKVVDPYRLDENLRLGTDWRPPLLQTHFRFTEDEGSFPRAVLRCVGVGECRKTDHGTMCPSYMATREEMHSTRGRSRLLFEMLRGETIADGWRSEAVREALDLCLACKGCKDECPVKVDMASYKAEFLSHYYAGRPRPRSAYAFGLIFVWARLASRMPGLVNFTTQTPGLRSFARAIAGIAPERRIPRFARRTFTAWFAERERAQAEVDFAGNHHSSDSAPSESGSVILWPDTFNNYFHPGTARAAVEVLEAAGFRVTVPSGSLCCGRPLYDYGFLDLAKHQLEQIVATLRPQIRAGTPIVVLEPSCAAVFRDELMGLVPHDEDARRLCHQTFLLSEFLEKRAPRFELPRLEGKALVHGHCHQKALWHMDDEVKVLQRLGLDVDQPDSGCCGMAGGFGFEGGNHYEVSIRAGERVLLPSVRAATPETFVVADGFSCREQIAQTTDRRALHLAEVIRFALRNPGTGGTELRTLAKARPAAANETPTSAGSALLRGGALLGGAGLGWWLSRRIVG